MRLLLIEDDAALRLGLARQLEADGYRVDQAADGEDGLFQAREYPVDLAIVDLGLPKLNGLTVVQRLRAEGRAMPILILTARGSWQDKVTGLESGADDYLVKPFEYPELAARIKALLRRRLGADGVRGRCRNGGATRPCRQRACRPLCPAAEHRVSPARGSGARHRWSARHAAVVSGAAPVAARIRPLREHRQRRSTRGMAVRIQRGLAPAVSARR